MEKFRKFLVIGIVLLFVWASFPVINSYETDQHCNEKNSATITFLLIGNGFLTIKFDGKEYRHGETIEVNVGEYSLMGGVCKIGTVFDNWASSGDITIEDPNSIDTTVYVYGDGSITLYSHYVPPSCFPAGTKITMADGTIKNIEDVKIGDLILGYDIELKKYTSWRVRIFERPMNPVCDINNGLIKLTPEHPISVKDSNGKIAVGAVEPLQNAMMIPGEIIKIEIGDKIYTSDGEWITITSITYDHTPIQLYNICSYMGKKNYFANGVLVYEDYLKPLWILKHIFKNSDTPLQCLFAFLNRLQFLP